MSHDAESQLKFTLDGLVNHLWIFTILFILAEKDVLQDLCNPTPLSDLIQKIGLNEYVLNNMFDVLKEQGAVIRKDNTVCFSKAMQALIASKGFMSIVLSVKLNQGKSAALVQDIRHNTWRHGWYHQDEMVLQGQGTLSEVVVTNFFVDVPRLTTQLSKPGCSLVDIGAGVAGLSLKFCECYPEVRVIAVEPADRPYKLAKENIEKSPYARRIELRKILAEELQEENVFDVIWFPQGFLIDEGVYQRSLKTLYRALKPGGLLLSVALPDDPGTAAVAKFVFSLCVADRSVQVLTEDFSKVGFENIEVLTIKDSIAPIIASKPR